MFIADKVVSGTMPFAEFTMNRSEKFIFLQLLDQSVINILFHDFACMVWLKIKCSTNKMHFHFRRIYRGQRSCNSPLKFRQNTFDTVWRYGIMKDLHTACHK